MPNLLLELLLKVLPCEEKISHRVPIATPGKVFGLCLIIDVIIAMKRNK